MENAKDGGANLAATLSEIRQVIAAANERHPRLRDSRVTVISDMGQNTWDSALASKDSFDALSQVARLQLIDVGTTDAANSWIASFRIAQPVTSVAQPTNCEVEIQHNERAAGRHVADVPAVVSAGGLRHDCYAAPCPCPHPRP